jgi:hypothetical protein
MLPFYALHELEHVSKVGSRAENPRRNAVDGHASTSIPFSSLSMVVWTLSGGKFRQSAPRVFRLAVNVADVW